MADRYRLNVTTQLLDRRTLRVVESRSMAPAARHKCYVYHTRSAEHKCSAYTPFALHVLHFMPRGISSSCCAAVSNTTNSSAGRWQETVSHRQDVLRQAARTERETETLTPLQKFTKRRVTDKWQRPQATGIINKLGNVNYVYKVLEFQQLQKGSG
jgi:hypothetical protein